MKSLAKALVEAAGFIELSGDDVVNPDAAVQALESIAHAVGAASKEEKNALLEYCRIRAKALAAASGELDQRRRTFYVEFGGNFGLLDE
jgi:hypothetical protein